MPLIVIDLLARQGDCAASLRLFFFVLSVAVLNEVVLVIVIELLNET